MDCCVQSSGDMKTDEEEEKKERRVNGVGPPASSVSTSRALPPPEASDLENSTTWYDTIFSSNTAEVEQVVILPLF